MRSIFWPCFYSNSTVDHFVSSLNFTQSRNWTKLDNDLAHASHNVLFNLEMDFSSVGDQADASLNVWLYF